MSKASGPVPISVIGTPVFTSTSRMNSLASEGKSSNTLTELHLGYTQSSLVIAACVAPLILAFFLAKSKSNGALRLSRPVPVAVSNQPRLIASSLLIPLFCEVIFYHVDVIV